MGGPKIMALIFFIENFREQNNADVRCDEQIRVHILVHAVSLSVRFSLHFFFFLVILNLHVIPAPLTSLFVLLTSGAYRPFRALGFAFFTGPSLPPHFLPFLFPPLRLETGPFNRLQLMGLECSPFGNRIWYAFSLQMVTDKYGYFAWCLGVIFLH